MLFKAYIKLFGALLFLKKVLKLDFKFILKRNSSKNITNGKKVVIAINTTSGLKTTNIELYLSHLLYKYNYEISIHTCNGLLKGCSLCEKERSGELNLNLKEIKDINCLPCKSLAKTISLVNLNKDINISTWPNLTRYDEKLIRNYIDNFKKNNFKELYKDCEVHEHAKSTLSRYLGRSIIDKEINNNMYLKSLYFDFLESACIAASLWINIISTETPDLIILNHGLYIPQGIVLEIAKRKDIKVATFHPGYRKGTVLIAHGDTYHKTLVDKDVNKFLNKKLNPIQLKRIKSYLRSKRDGSQDQISFAHKNAEKFEIPKNLTRLKNKILVLTNVDWDAQSHYKNNVYESMNEWILDIIALAKSQKNYNFIFRCHPAEVTGRRISSVKTADFINENSSDLKNIFVVRSEDKLSTYKLIEKSKAVIVYATKTSIEAACMRKPVLICGESCMRGKNIGIDLSSKTHLQNDFKKLVGNFEVNLERALRYAYHFFYREMIDIPKFSNFIKTEEEYNFIKRLFDQD